MVEIMYGLLCVGDFVEWYLYVCYVQIVDEFWQVVGILFVDEVFVNGGYFYDVDLVWMLFDFYLYVMVECVDVMGEFDRFDLLFFDDCDVVVVLEVCVGVVFVVFECFVVVCLIVCMDFVGFYVVDFEVFCVID